MRKLSLGVVLIMASLRWIAGKLEPPIIGTYAQFAVSGLVRGLVMASKSRDFTIACAQVYRLQNGSDWSKQPACLLCRYLLSGNIRPRRVLLLEASGKPSDHPGTLVAKWPKNIAGLLQTAENSTWAPRTRGCPCSTP